MLVVSDAPDAGPAFSNLQSIIEETASEADYELFVEAWYGCVRNVLSNDSLFTVRPMTLG